MIGLGRLVGGETAEPPVARMEAARLVDGREHGEVVRARQLEVLASTPGRDVDDPGALGELDALPRDHPVIDVLRRRQIVERADVAPADEVAAALDLDEALVGVVLRPRPTRPRRCGRTRSPGGRRRPRSPAASTASSSRRRATPRHDRRAAGARTATGAPAPGRRRPGSARAARARCRSAGTTPTSGGRGTASRARGTTWRKRQMYSMLVSLNVK